MPNYNKTFTCTLFYSEKEFQAENYYYGNNLQNFLKFSFPDVASIIPDFACQFLEKKTSSMFSVKSPAWVYRDNAVIIGDAAHAIVPFYGMGMNIGFEDCTVFNSLIDDFN
ncbi:MAG: FAD-dependent oxidoreductase, partial [Ignavibacteria bacterium]